MTARDHSAPGCPPDWSAAGQGFRPVTIPARPRHKPQAVRRMLSATQVDAIWTRGFTIGCITTIVASAVGAGLVLLLGGHL